MSTPIRDAVIRARSEYIRAGGDPAEAVLQLTQEVWDDLTYESWLSMPSNPSDTERRYAGMRVEIIESGDVEVK